jgi:hypothetical protein
MCAGAFVWAVAACHSARPGSAPAAGSSSSPCEPPRGALPPGVTAAGLAGEYRLHITATSGSSTGRWVEGTLRLAPVADPAAGAVVVMGVKDPTSAYALTGSGELDPATLGAVSTGSLATTDPEAPGVLVMERHPRDPGAGTEIILRLGSDANQRGRLRYDGGYFALMVRGIGPRGFTGTWSSGAGAASSAGGYFCAERTAAGR